jgi:hypothetical protein
LHETGQLGRVRFFFLTLFAVTLALRLCHSRILWADEDYHLAAGIQTLHGKLLYKDLWYDKPPLAAWIYAAIGGFAGWTLRLFDAAYILAICAAMYRFKIWGQTERFLATGLLAFFLNFDHATAVIPVAPDLFMMLPHIAAVYCAWRGKALLAGLWSGIAFLFHTKGVFVLAMCALLCWRALTPLLLGFLIPNGLAAAVLAIGGALTEYIRQVWQWGISYTTNPPSPVPLWDALRRTLDWLGFHTALALGAAATWWKDRMRGSRWILAWCVVSFAGVALGTQFRPRYFLQLLPPLVLAASRGVTLLLRDRGGRRSALAGAMLSIALLIPLIRFGPRYAVLAWDQVQDRPHRWQDVVLNQDSQAAAAAVYARKQPGDTLFVWGYRPDLFVYTRLPAASQFWDSQPLTGVPADRHLFDSHPILPEWAARNRAVVTASHPTFIVDGLSILNPGLSIDTYPELRAWLKDYRVVARTKLSVIYRAADRPVAAFD